MRARRPAAIISRASAGVSAPNSGNNGVRPVPARRSSRYRRMSSRNRSPNAIVREPFGHGPLHGAAHRALVDVVRARRRNRNLPQRQPERVGLRLQHVDTHRVHRDPLRRLVDRRQQRRRARHPAAAGRAPSRRCPCRSTTTSASSFEELGMQRLAPAARSRRRRAARGRRIPRLAA